MQQQPIQKQFNVDMRNATPKVCDCGSEYFIPVVKCFTVSALVSPTGQDMTVQQPVLICRMCGELLK